MRGEFNIEQIGIIAGNLITTAGRDSILSAVATDQPPGWRYMAVGTGSSAPGSAQTMLDCEIHREPITAGFMPASGTAKLMAVFGPQVGNGTWREIGIFDSDASRPVLSTCEGTAGWSSDGTLVQETTIVQQGAASLRSQMTGSGTIAFHNGSLNCVYSGTAWRLQFWYRSSINPGTLTVRLWNHSGGAYQERSWPFVPGTSNAWVLCNILVGTALYPSGSITAFRLTHPAQGVVFDEYLDYISLFQPSGILLCRGTVNAVKSWNTVWNVYYSLRV